MRASALLALYIGTAAASVPWQDVQLRLLSPLTSYSQSGTSFTAKLIGPLVRDGYEILPSGTIVRGSVIKALAVGLGIRRERASISLEFQGGCDLPWGETVPCDVRLLSIDNARESVAKDNVIRGILAANHPYSWLNGVWYKPVPALLQRSAVGLTGAAGMVYTHMLPSPTGAAIIIASRLIFLRMPDPEIELPPGTELTARISLAGGAVHSEVPVLASAVWAHDVITSLREAPVEVTRPDRSPEADIINLAFAGSRSELEAAFEAAGWWTAESVNAKTLTRTYTAFASMKAYPRAPVSTLHYQGRPPDLVFQKSFNSVAKRHHIRIWKTDIQGETVWLGAATHDTAIVFDRNRMSITHKIDPQIDRERSQIVNDLAENGCVAGLQTIDRPGRSRNLVDGAHVITDGALVGLALRQCDSRDRLLGSVERPKKGPLTLATRRAILETRQYLLRGNVYYLGYRAARWGVSAWRPARDDDE